VINRPKDMMHNFSKLWQLHFIQEAGFLVPQSQVLANYRCDQGIGDKIFKSISSHRSIVEKVRNNHRRQVHEPVLFQQDCGRHNVRVHVLDQYTFAHHIVSKQVDYRYDTGSKMLDYQLTQQMQQKFVDLAQSLHLRFAGIDLMIEENKEYVLEVNPSPGYAYYEVNMASNIMTQTLIKALGLHV
jgi:glutathione synthase/RimK-type ligase-like ATP-grasp enzyme